MEESEIGSDRKTFTQIFQATVKKLILYTTTHVTKRTQNRLVSLVEAEKSNPITSSQLQLMLENITYAKQHSIPVCQDTGHINIFIQLGNQFPFIPDFSNLIFPVIKELTAEGILRPNSVDPFTHQNPNDNSGKNMPPIYLEIVPDSSNIVLTILNKGGGSENWSKLFMFNPSSGFDELIPSVISQMVKAGGKPCAPTILGVGIGGDAAKCMYNAKKALLRPLGIPHPREDIALLEKKLLSALNSEDIGIMGLGGHSNCLDVRIEYAMRHPATYPVGLIVECYCHRKGSFAISPNNDVIFGTLSNMFEFVPGELIRES